MNFCWLIKFITFAIILSYIVHLCNLNTIKLNKMATEMVTTASNTKEINYLINDFIELNSDADYDKIKELYTNSSTKKILYINSNGGDLFKGIDMIKFIIHNNISCFAKKANGMAFSIYNFCENRYYNNQSTFQQREIIINFLGNIRQMGEKYNYLKKVILSIITHEAHKLGIPNGFYYELIKNKFNINGTDTSMNLGTYSEITSVSYMSSSGSCSSLLTNTSSLSSE